MRDLLSDQMPTGIYILTFRGRCGVFIKFHSQSRLCWILRSYFAPRQQLKSPFGPPKVTRSAALPFQWNQLKPDLVSGGQLLQSYAGRWGPRTSRVLQRLRCHHLIVRALHQSKLDAPWSPRPILGRDSASNIRSQTGDSTVALLLRGMMSGHPPPSWSSLAFLVCWQTGKSNAHLAQAGPLTWKSVWSQDRADFAWSCCAVRVWPYLKDRLGWSVGRQGAQ